MAQCEGAGFDGGQRVLAAYDPSLYQPLRVAARPPDAQPERAVLKVVRAGDVAETTLVEGASANAGVVLAASPEGKLAFVWVADDPAKPRAQASEIRLRLCDGANWGEPISITSDSHLDSSPAAAFDGKGQVIIVWHTKPSEAADPALDEACVRQMEIGYAVETVTDSLVGALW